MKMVSKKIKPLPKGLKATITAKGYYEWRSLKSGSIAISLGRVDDLYHGFTIYNPGGKLDKKLWWLLEDEFNLLPITVKEPEEWL